MANYATLISAIQSVITENGNNEITGPILQQALISIINALGSGYQYVGIATPETTPGTPDQKVFYIGSAGTYPNFGPAVIPDGNMGIFYYDSSWHVGTVAFPIGDGSVTTDKLANGSVTIDKLAQQVKDILNELTLIGNEDADLDIADDSGNVLARFANGHFRTKFFNSIDAITKAIIEIIDNQESDLDISDGNGMVLARFYDGHFRTKFFNSKKFSDAPTSGYENFLVQVNKAVPNNVDTTGNIQDSDNPQYDRCIINFPVNYSASGDPIRLVIANFGSAGRIQSSTTKAYHTMPLVDTILAEGYAVMQVNGTPGQTDGIATFGGMGTPQFLSSVRKAYEYVTAKYNIKTDGVLLSGWSQGTLKSWQIAANKIIPVRAAALFGPAVDLWKLQYAYAPRATREWMCEQFGFVEKEANKYVLDIFSDIYQTGDIVTKPTTYSAEKTLPNAREFAYILNNFETWLGYDPICWGTSKDIIGEQFRYRSWVTTPNPNEDLCFEDVCNVVPCPMKLFVGTADIYTTPKIVNWFKTMANNAGVLCHVRTYQGGTHDFPNDYQTIQVQTKYGGTITTNVPSWEGMLFLERFD